MVWLVLEYCSGLLATSKAKLPQLALIPCSRRRALQLSPQTREASGRQGSKDVYTARGRRVLRSPAILRASRSET